MELSTNLPYGSEAIQRHIDSGASLKMNVSSEADADFMRELKRTAPGRYNRLLRNMELDYARRKRDSVVSQAA